jgi:hypothetical protein
VLVTPAIGASITGVDLKPANGEGHGRMLLSSLRFSIHRPTPCCGAQAHRPD